MHVVKYRFNGSVIAEIWAKTTAAMLLHEIGVKNLAEKLDEIRGDGVLSLTKLDSKNVFFLPPERSWSINWAFKMQSNLREELYSSTKP